MECFLTTYDNPYDPFTDFDSWYNYDSTHLNASAYLARVALTSIFLSDKENEREIERAIDEIVALQPMIYKKVVKESNEQKLNTHV